MKDRVYMTIKKIGKQDKDAYCRGFIALYLLKKTYYFTNQV